jgi:hypothetical protein
MLKADVPDKEAVSSILPTRAIHKIISPSDNFSAFIFHKNNYYVQKLVFDNISVHAFLLLQSYYFMFLCRKT